MFILIIAIIMDYKFISSVKTGESLYIVEARLLDLYYAVYQLGVVSILYLLLTSISSIFTAERYPR